MKNLKISIFLGTMLFLFTSCTDFLEPLPNGDITEDELWEYQEKVQGLIGQCYDYMPRNYNDNEGAYLDCATDNAVITSTTSNMRRLATGTLTTGQDMFSTYWVRDYKAINLVNTFLKDRRGFNTRFMVKEHLDSLVRYRLQGEAFGLRAWFQWDLLQKFGGKGINGQMLGFPIVLEPLDPTTDINLSRNSYDQCVEQILMDCDSAIRYLPIAHRDFLVPETDRTNAGGKYWGRLDGITMQAIKASVYLTWASPRFNPDNDIARWDSAAVMAKKVIDFKLTVDNVTNGFNPSAGVNWFNPNFPGIVLSSRYLAGNDDMERMFYPAGFQGNGAMGITQELVDAFPMKNGYPITNPLSGYNPEDPYKDRDPRFYSMVFYNNAKAIRAGTSNVMYTFENFVGGKDEAGANAQNSRTNYHIKKFVFMGLNWSDATINRQPHSKFFVRWAHMCLAFAEAANQVVGPNNEVKYGLSAKTAIQYLRARKTYDGLDGISQIPPIGADPYLFQIAASGVTAFDEFIKNERRIETCLEGIRFYDLRRWTTNLDDLNKAVHGVRIIRNPNDGSFTYDFNVVVESRVYRSAYLPIPYTEILKMGNLIQNEGWEGWY